MFSHNRRAGLDGPALTDEQTRAQVVGVARRIVGGVGLQNFTASFSFASCSDGGAPPYRGTSSISFPFPADVDPKAYIERVAATMVADGWVDGPPNGKRPYGRVVHLGRMMAVMALAPNHPGLGDIKIYGECRNLTDHRKDDGPVYEDITAELTG